MFVAQILDTKGSEVISVGPDQEIWAVLRKFQINRVGSLVVVDEAGRLLGLLTERDVVNGLLSRGAGLLHASVGDAMTTDVATCAPGDSVANAMQTMTDRRMRHLPVVQRGKLHGVISLGDLVKARLDDAELECRILRNLSRARS